MVIESAANKMIFNETRRLNQTVLNTHTHTTDLTGWDQCRQEVKSLTCQGESVGLNGGRGDRGRRQAGRDLAGEKRPQPHGSAEAIPGLRLPSPV